MVLEQIQEEKEPSVTDRKEKVQKKYVCGLNIVKQKHPDVDFTHI